MEEKKLTITVRGENLQIEHDLGDVVPVRVTQSLEIREYGVLGGGPILDLDEDKYWPLHLVTDENPTREMSAIVVLAAALDVEYLESPAEASPWKWSGTVFTRTLLTRQGGPPPTITAYVISANGKNVPRHDFMQLVDEATGKPVQCWPDLSRPDWRQRYNDTPEIEFPAGTNWGRAKGLGEIMIAMERIFPAKVPPGGIGAGLPVKWQYGSNRFYRGGEEYVFTRMVVSGSLGQTPDELKVKVLRSWSDPPDTRPLIEQTAQFIGGADEPIEWRSGEGQDWLPLVTVQGETIAGIHGRDTPSGRQVGAIEWLMRRHPPEDATDPAQHWNWKDSQTFMRKARTDQARIEILAESVLWEDPT